ncbi:hypothetical protein SAMN05444920_113205 [Nonomuraea solani]|uniref:Uncharacterized protein n=2 Tax=Nonomuraea solani TaxID=1144553 RepID=A0A1H6ES08_9ACTN|nr:hypothetical protein SAMN05444920_113205 [Nonomuraea solani]
MGHGNRTGGMMDESNHWYGHSRILGRYCGQPDESPKRIQGFLQHGWNYLHGFPPNDHWCSPGYPRFVWSDVLRRRGWSMGRRSHYLIGAPWIYLLYLEPELGVRPDRDGTIWYPFHGWEKHSVSGDHARLADEIRNVETGPVTVCLYWLEFANPDIRQSYESRGFRVICHGERGSRWEGKGRDFLRKQLVELRRHRRVASNRLGSALFYGASVGCDVAVYGDPMQFEDERPEYGGTARRMRLWPDLHGTSVDPGLAAEVARRELGFEYQATPEELRRMFGWKPARGGTGGRPCLPLGVRSRA